MTPVRPAATTVVALILAACQTDSTPPAAPAPRTAAFLVTFSDNPVPFRTTGCSASTPQGWYTAARVQETAGVAFTPGALIQKLDGNVTSLLDESFSSRFAACPDSAISSGVIPANGAACGSVGVCSTNRFSTYQFQMTGNDASGHAVTVDSPVLQLGAP